jgi:hypothetical protein
MAQNITFMVAVDNARPRIPNSLLPGARALISDRWKTDPDDRPMFKEIMDRLAAMNFRVSARRIEF